ncbi:hypothetical protein KIW84_063330 [Lathyrus oleraceus]|uniref:Uncharacterized protein n=1 Tax=Pisum sativum TaxID=3888 RepID=A0A9D4W8N3_PEA|nr:hypothetical protein KIW84_063330 [Pisum sativum]
MSAKELAETYRELLIEWKESCLREHIQKKTISAPLLEEDKLGSTILDLEEEVTLLKSKLDNMIKFVRMLNNGFDMLDDITEIGEKKAIGFDYSSMNKKVLQEVKENVKNRKVMLKAKRTPYKKIPTPTKAKKTPKKKKKYVVGIKKSARKKGMLPS